MIVRQGIATVVVADWFGKNEDGSPFHGSIVRGFDATDPANIKTIGDAKLGGWVRDTRVVGDVLYAVSEEYPWWGYYYGYDDVGVGEGVATSSAFNTSKVVVSSVNFANGHVQAVGRYDKAGDSAIFNVTPNAILLAHQVVKNGTNGYPEQTNTTALDYIDISDPAGAITPRGHFEFSGSVQGWGSDNGRWNVDFADGKTAHAIGCADQSCGGQQGNYVLTTVDYADMDHPVEKSRLLIPATGWTPAARFDAGRMYLSPSDILLVEQFQLHAGAGLRPS